MDWLDQFWFKIWPSVSALFSADLTATIILSFFTAGAGAFAGAVAAQRISERNRLKDELVKEIRCTNAAISITFDIINAFLAIKEQNVRPLQELFDKDKLRFFQSISAEFRGEEEGVVEFVLDLRSLPEAIVSEDRLQNIVFEELSVIGKPINLVSVLLRSINELNKSIIKRNYLIEKFMEIPSDNYSAKLRLYFGAPDRHGHVDENYPTVMDAISKYTDDCIWFSKALIDELMSHGEVIRNKYKNKFRGKPPRLASVDLTVAADGLIPPDKNYEDWTVGFKKKL